MGEKSDRGVWMNCGSPVAKDREVSWLEFSAISTEISRTIGLLVSGNSTVLTDDVVKHRISER